MMQIRKPYVYSKHALPVRTSVLPPPRILCTQVLVRNGDIVWLGETKTKDSRGEGGMDILRELKIADFAELCGGIP